MAPESHNPVWTLSGFADEIDTDPRVQFAVLRALGARYAEVRSAWGVNIVDLSDAQVDEVKLVLAHQGMGVSAVASPIGKVQIGSLEAELETSRLRRVLNVARSLDARYVRVFSFYREPDQAPADVRDDVLKRMSELAHEAEKAGVVLVHENEKGIYGDTPERVLELIEAVGSEFLRVAWDAANFVQVGVRPFDEALPLLRPYIEYVQVKDALAESGRVVVAGEGDGQLAETFDALISDGYNGFVSLEPHLQDAHEFGGFTGPAEFGRAARAFTGLLTSRGGTLA